MISIVYQIYTTQEIVLNIHCALVFINNNVVILIISV